MLEVMKSIEFWACLQGGQGLCMVLHQLLMFIKDSKVAGLFMKLVFKGGCKPELLVNIEISLDIDFCKGRGGQNVFHCGI